MIDTSQETIDAYWRALLADHSLTDDSLPEVAAIERGEVLNSAQYSAAMLEQAQTKTKEMVDEMLRKPLMFLAKRVAPNWNITDKEIDKLVPLYAELVAKYMPDFYANPVAVKIYALFVGQHLEVKIIWHTFWLFRKRAGVPLRIPKQNKEKQELKEQDKQPMESKNDQFI